MLREHNSYKRVKRRLTFGFLVGGGVLVPIGEDWLAETIHAYFNTPEASWGPDAIAISLVAAVFVCLFGLAQSLLDFSFRNSSRTRRWIFGSQWIEGKWIDEIRKPDIARSASVQFSYEDNGEIKVVGMVVVNSRLLYKFESIKTTMNGAELQFMYRTVGTEMTHDAYGYACYNFCGEGSVPDLYIGYFVDTEGLGRVPVEGRRLPDRAGNEQ